MIPFASSLQIGINPAEGTSLFVSIHTVHCENAWLGDVTVRNQIIKIVVDRYHRP